MRMRTIDDHSLQSALQVIVKPGKEYATDPFIPEFLNKLRMIDRVKYIWEVQVHNICVTPPCHR